MNERQYKIKDDERALLIALYQESLKPSKPVELSFNDNYHVTPIEFHAHANEVRERLGMSFNRAQYLLGDKWLRSRFGEPDGWYEYGGSWNSGWLTEIGKYHANALLNGEGYIIPFKEIAR